MNIRRCSVILVLALAATCFAQTTPAAPAQGAADASANAQPEVLDKIPPGTLIAAELTKAVDAKKAKSGDKVEVKTTVDLLAHGQIVIASNSRITAHLTSAKPHSKDSPDSALAIAFDSIIMKDGRELPLPAAIQAIGRPLVQAVVSSTDPPNPGRSTASAGSAPPADSGSADSPIGVQNTVGHYPTVNNGATAAADPTVSAIVLSPQSHGAVGMPDLALTSSKDGSVISCNKKNVHLDNGTQLILRID